MVFIEVTRDVARHKTDRFYRCVRVHFLDSDRHFHQTMIRLRSPGSDETSLSLANWMPLDDEIVELIEKRLEAKNPEDLVMKLDKILQKHGYKIKIYT